MIKYFSGTFCENLKLISMHNTQFSGLFRKISILIFCIGILEGSTAGL